MADRRMTANEVAQHLGIRPATWWSYVKKARKERARGKDRFTLAPNEDGREELSGTPWWWCSTVDAWNATRPGRGTRTDRYSAANLAPKV